MTEEQISLSVLRAKHEKALALRAQANAYANDRLPEYFLAKDLAIDAEEIRDHAADG